MAVFTFINACVYRIDTRVPLRNRTGKTPYEVINGVFSLGYAQFWFQVSVDPWNNYPLEIGHTKST